MSFQSLLDILRCPACVSHEGVDPGQLTLIDGKWLVCHDCNRKYPIRDGIPVMLIDEGARYIGTPVDELGAP